MVGLFAEDVPDQALLLIAGDGHAAGGGVALRQGADGDIVVHAFFLSQASPGAVQEPELLADRLPLGFQLPLALGETRVQGFRVAVDRQQGPDLRQGKAHVPQGRDTADHGELGFAVVAVVGEAVGLGGLQQSDGVIVAQHPDADPGQLGELSDLQHGGTSHPFSELRKRVSPDRV